MGITKWFPLFFLTLGLALCQNDDVAGFWNPHELFHSLEGPPILRSTYVTVDYMLPSCEGFSLEQQANQTINITRGSGSRFEANGLRFEPLSRTFSSTPFCLLDLSSHSIFFLKPEFQDVEVETWMQSTGLAAPDSNIGLATTAIDSPRKTGFNFLGFRIVRTQEGDVLNIYSFPSSTPSHRPNTSYSVPLDFDASADFHRNFLF